MNNLIEDNKCYKKELIKFDSGLYDDSIDCAYILYLEGNNDRYLKLMEQIKKYPLTKNIYLLRNKGYKNCKKNVDVTIPTHDCIYSHYEAYVHAELNEFNNIIVLEDDFIFDKDIDNEENINAINSFLNKKKNTNFIYLFGTIPIIINKRDFYHYETTFFGGAHTYVISKKCRQKILNQNKQDFINYIDFEGNLVNNSDKVYMFYKPLSYQTFPVTENQKIWKNMYGNIMYYIYVYSIKVLKLDKQVQPGYDIVYFLAKLLPIIVVIVFLLIFIWLRKKLI
jgi:hypothetical protein